MKKKIKRVARKQLFTVRDGKVMKPKGVFLGDVMAFIENATHRELKIINLTIREVRL